MNRKLGAPLALALTVGLGVPLGAAPASADAPTDLYVNNTAGANCSDAGSGTSIQPYCTLAAAAAVVTAGQTVIVTGTYQEHLTIARSGEPGLPITFRSGLGMAKLTAPAGGITIDGQHDVTIGRFSIYGERTDTGIAVSNSTRITLDGTMVYATGTSPVAPGIHLNAVTDSTVTRANVRGPLTTGILLDAATHGVTVRSSFVAPPGFAGDKGIDVFGSSNTIVANTVQFAGMADIAIEAGARDNIVANNWVQNAHGRGIDNIGAIGTAITNNTVEWLCDTGIRVGDGSSGVSVQNNIAGDNGYPQTSCPAGISDPVDIGVYGTATSDTVVDYNSVYGRGDHSYAWNTPMTLTAFRAASAQGAHDIDTSPYNSSSRLNIDSANSAAPGWQGVDSHGEHPADDPSVTNTGAGPIGYADRGASEKSGPPAARLTVTARPMGAGTVITADASGSAAWTPLTLTKYTFDFGDGITVTQSSPIAWHVYPRNIFRRGLHYQVTVGVTDSNRSVAVAASPSTSWIYQGLPPTAPRHPALVRRLR